MLINRTLCYGEKVEKVNLSLQTHLRQASCKEHPPSGAGGWKNEGDAVDSERTGRREDHEEGGLTAPGSAVAVELIFSGGRDTIGLRRASLDAEDDPEIDVC
ncbi:hypothetical protein B0H14DRAFT_3441826 [Mycena olivaceomarginata]|nr:hypothetical protein B0H14DRAFT_3441826 [Mycena olivaceomarginata]